MDILPTEEKISKNTLGFVSKKKLTNSENFWIPLPPPPREFLDN